MDERIKGVNGEGDVVNRVGCGDSRVGGMVGGLWMGVNVDEGFEEGVG